MERRPRIRRWWSFCLMLAGFMGAGTGCTGFSETPGEIASFMDWPDFNQRPAPPSPLSSGIQPAPTPNPIANTIRPISAQPADLSANQIVKPAIKETTPIEGSHLELSAPTTVVLGQDVACTLTLTNYGPREGKSYTVRHPIPPGMQYLRSEPAANLEGNQLIWTLGSLAVGAHSNLKAVFHAAQVGSSRFTASLEADAQNGPKEEKTFACEVTAPQLRIGLTAPNQGTVGVPVAFRITVQNVGNGPATHVLLTAAFDPGLKHESKANPLECPVGDLATGASKTIDLALTPLRAGTLANRLKVVADGDLKDETQHTVSVTEPLLRLSIAGPSTRFVGRPATWIIEASNPGDVPLTQVVVHGLIPAEMTCQTISDGGQVVANAKGGGQVQWDLGTLAPRTKKQVQVTTRCDKESAQATVEAVANAAPGSQQARAQAAIKIRVLPSLRLKVVDTNDPVEVGGQTTYQITVTNSGTKAAGKVQVAAEVPTQMSIVEARGPVQPRIDGQRILYPPLDSLGVGQSLLFTVVVKALQGDDVRFRVELSGGALTEPIVAEESTTIYQNLGAVAAPVKTTTVRPTQPANGATQTDEAPPPDPTPDQADAFRDRNWHPTKGR